MAGLGAKGRGANVESYFGRRDVVGVWWGWVIMGN